MHFDEFDLPSRQELSQFLGPELARLVAASAEPEAGGSFSLHECCRAWIFDLPTQIPDDQPLEIFRRPGEIWHHQIWREGKPQYYARSERVGATPPEPSIRLLGVMRSRFATEFDEALAQLEAPRNAGKVGPPDQDWLVRLLIVPRFDYRAFVLVAGDEIQKAVPLIAAADWDFRVLDGQSLRREILHRPISFGLG